MAKRKKMSSKLVITVATQARDQRQCLRSAYKEAGLLTSTGYRGTGATIASNRDKSRSKAARSRDKAALRRNEVG